MGATLVALLNVIGSILKVRGQDDLGQYARLAASLVQRGAQAQGEFEQLTADLQAMVDKGEDPTEDQVASVRNRRKELSALLQASVPDDPEDDPEAA